MKLIDIIIVNWNSGSQLEDCINSIIATEQFDSLVGHVIIVDNASCDNSLEFASKNQLEKILIVHNKSNEGFGRACNIGAKHSRTTPSKYILFLNPDTVLFKKTLVETVDAISNSSKDIGISGIRLISENGYVSTTCSRFPSVFSLSLKSFGLINLFSSLKKHDQAMLEFDHLADREVDQVMGAFFLIRKDLFFDLNGFDERFFVYYEEVDLSFRARNLGYKTVFFSGPSAVHIGCGTSEQVKDKRLFYNTYSKTQYFEKHYNKLVYLWVIFVALIIEPLIRIGFSVISIDKNGVINTFKGYYMLYRKFIQLLYRKVREI